MSFPIGVFPSGLGNPANESRRASNSKSGTSPRSLLKKTTSVKDALLKDSESSSSLLGSAKKSAFATKLDSGGRKPRPLSNPLRDEQAALPQEEVGVSLSARTSESTSINSGSSRATTSADRSRHIPIVVPNYDSIIPKPSESRLGSFSSWKTGDSDFPSTPALPDPSRNSFPITNHWKPRHVEIKIPSWAEPVLKQPSTPPRISLTPSIFQDPFADLSGLSSPEVSPTAHDPFCADAMENSTPALSPDQSHADASNTSSHAFLSSANSSQSSLVGQRDEYESASEAGSGTEDEQRGSHTPSQSAPTPQLQPPVQGSNASNLSGLVCNVHRTSGREPPSLVGATTTILGDKLYVFGGRRLSRNKPQLTSNLYELDLIRRHWVKLNVKGDVPPPRYFHSVCPLGDAKLVCYGGMSPTPPAVEEGAQAQTEVTVMSDIHIFDVTTKTWTKISTQESPQGRYAHCAAILPSSAVFASAQAPMSAVHHNPPSSNPNQGSLGVTLDGTGGAEMVVVGGQDSANHYIEQISVFNLRSLKWTDTSGMDRSCGAYRSVVTPLTTMSASHIGAGPHARSEMDDEDEDPAVLGSGAPMIIYSNYNFLDVKLELQIRLPDGTLVEKEMQTGVSPPGLRFPNGGIIASHFVVSGTFLTSSKQEYAIWALDLRTLTWSRIDGGGSIFSHGSWNRGVLWSRRNTFVILGNRKRSLVDDYNNRRINFTNICLLELEAFGLYDNPRRAAPASSYLSVSSPLKHTNGDPTASGSSLFPAGEDLGALSMTSRELADMEFLTTDGTRIPVNSRLIARRWGSHFVNLMRESLAANTETETATLRAGSVSHTSRNSSITITPSVASTATTLTANHNNDILDVRSSPPTARSRLFYLPHTAPTLHALLHYLYTSSLPSSPSPLATPQILCSLLQFARPYKIDGLLEAVVERLHESLDGRNAAAIFNAAAMAAGGGDGIRFAPAVTGARESTIPLRGASLAGPDGSTSNGGARASNSLRIDTDMANGRSTRNTIRPGQPLLEDSDDEAPMSAATDASMSEDELSMSTSSLTGKGDSDRSIWTGAVSSVVGLQKRGLRGLMEGRRMRERGTSATGEARVGLGIA